MQNGDILIILLKMPEIIHFSAQKHALQEIQRHIH